MACLVVAVVPPDFIFNTQESGHLFTKSTAASHEIEIKGAHSTGWSSVMKLENRIPANFPPCTKKLSHLKLDLSRYFADCLGLAQWFFFNSDTFSPTPLSHAGPGLAAQQQVYRWPVWNPSPEWPLVPLPRLCGRQKKNKQKQNRIYSFYSWNVTPCLIRQAPKSSCIFTCSLPLQSHLFCLFVFSSVDSSSNHSSSVWKADGQKEKDSSSCC